MKRRMSLFLILAACSAVISAQAIDKPAATVRLTRAETISVRKLRKTVDPLEQRAGRALTVEERKTILDGLVNRALIEQSAEKDKIYVSDAELKLALDQQKKDLGAQAAGRELTDAELQTVIKSSGVTWDEYVATIKYSQLILKYAQFKRPDLVSKIPQPTEEDAKEFYDANKTKYFVYDDMARIKWILVDTRNLTSKDERDKAAKRADDILKELKGGAKFEELVAKYSDDTSSKYKGGDKGYLIRSDTQVQQMYGTALFNAAFSVKKGETSGIIQTNVGYAIIMVTDRIDARILNLDDKIPPEYAKRVGDRVKEMLLAQRQNEAYTKSLTDIVAELKKQAEVKIFEENLGW